MSNIVIVAGKGGTGKTTLSALITLYLAGRKAKSVLAIDADPNSNLGDSLGVKPSGTIADIIESVSKNPESVPKSMGKDAFIRYKIHNDIMENKGFDLLVMGRPEGPGCYCYINNVLRSIMAGLAKDYKFVVIDNEAGMEHFSRKITQSCKELIVVSDQTSVGLKSAARIFDLIDELNIQAGRKFLVINRFKGDTDSEFSNVAARVDEVFKIPFDEEISNSSSSGLALSGLSKESAALKAINAMGEYIWPTI